MGHKGHAPISLHSGFTHATSEIKAFCVINVVVGKQEEEEAQEK